MVFVHADDPVFASSAISTLFGVRKVAIARQTANEYDGIVSAITEVGGNLILSGERFLVRVEGTAAGFVPKDVEIAATSSIIEKKSELGARPGTDGDHDKMLYTYLTRRHAYVCIFVDSGSGGIPCRTREKAACAVYDEISAISCYETIKQGYDTEIIVCYRQRSELTGLAKVLNRLIPRLIQGTVELRFYELKLGSRSAGDYLVYVNSVLEILLDQPGHYVSLALSPLMFSAGFLENAMKRVFEAGKTPIVPLAGVDYGMFDDAVEIGLGHSIRRLEKAASLNVPGIPAPAEKQVAEALGTVQCIAVTVGPQQHTRHPGLA